MVIRPFSRLRTGDGVMSLYTLSEWVTYFDALIASATSPRSSTREILRLDAWSI